MSKADHALTTAKQKRRTIAVKPAALSQIEDVARELAGLWAANQEYDETTAEMPDESLPVYGMERLQDQGLARIAVLESFLATLEPHTARETLIHALLLRNKLENDELEVDVEVKTLARAVIRGLERVAGVTADDLGLAYSYFSECSRRTFTEEAADARSEAKAYITAELAAERLS
jgi:hypothetical protein